MKKLVVAAILTIIICVCWLLYLNYSHQRFIDDIGTTPMSSTQSTKTSDIQTLSDDADAVQVDVTTSEGEVKNASITDIETTDGLNENHFQKTTVEEVINSFERQLTEVDGLKATKTKDAFENFLESQGITIEQYEKQEIAHETLQRIINNPKRWLDGNPDLILVTNEEMDELFKSNDILLDRKHETPTSGESVLPKDAIGIKQNADGSWSFVYKTDREPTQ